MVCGYRFRQVSPVVPFAPVSGGKKGDPRLVLVHFHLPFFLRKTPLLGDETQVGVPLPLGVPCSRLVVGGGGSSLVLVPFRTEKKSPFWGRRKNSVCISVISV